MSCIKKLRKRGGVVLSNIYEKLRNAQVELKAPKGQYNSHGRYNYRSAEDILEEVKPINQKYGLTLTISDDIVQVADRVYVRATAVLTDGKETLRVTAFAREVSERKGMDGSQITGASSSYARKYALNGLYLIDDTKDADTDEQQIERTMRYNQDKSAHKNMQQPPSEAERVKDVEKAYIKVCDTLIAQHNGTQVAIEKHIEKVARQPLANVDIDTKYVIVKNLIDRYESAGS